MIQRRQILGDLTLEREIRRDEGGDWYVYDYDVQNARGVGVLGTADGETLEWLERTATSLDCFDGHEFVRDELDQADSDRASERVEAMGWA